MPKLLSISAVSAEPGPAAETPSLEALVGAGARPARRGVMGGIRPLAPSECRHALYLAARSIGECLGRAGIGAEGVDHLLAASSSTVASPSLEDFLAQALPFPRDLRRTPLGAHGATAGLTRACDALRARPRDRALLVCLALRSFAFAPGAAADGADSIIAEHAAALLLGGDAEPGDALAQFIDSESAPASRTLAVAEPCGDGIRLAAPSSLSAAAALDARAALERLLARRGLSREGLRALLVDPGLLPPEEAAVALGARAADRELLARHARRGLPMPWMLRDALARAPRGAALLLASFGASLDCELVLLRA